MTNKTKHSLQWHLECLQNSEAYVETLRKQKRLLEEEIARLEAINVLDRAHYEYHLSKNHYSFSKREEEDESTSH